MNRRALFLLGFFAISATSCGPKRPIVHADPVLSRTDIASGRIAYALADSPDIRAAVQEFVAGFSGNPREGLRFFERRLKVALNRGIPASIPPTAIVEVPQSVGEDSIKSVCAIEMDEFGVRSLIIRNPDHLETLLAEAGAENFLYLSGLTVIPGKVASVGPGLHVGNGIVYVPSSTQSMVHISSQAFLWSANTRTIRWNGWVAGSYPMIQGFTKETAGGLAESFARDVRVALFAELPKGEVNVNRRKLYATYKWWEGGP